MEIEFGWHLISSLTQKTLTNPLRVYRYQSKQKLVQVLGHLSKMLLVLCFQSFGELRAANYNGINCFFSLILLFTESCFN